MNPDPVPGVVWRASTKDELDCLEAFYRGWEGDFSIPYRTSRGELEHWMDDPNVELERDTRIAVTADGEIVAAAWVFAGSRSDRKHRAIVMTAARADHAECERPAIRWGEQVARSRFAEYDDDLERIVRSFAETHETSRIGAFESEGYEIVRYFVDMTRRLDRMIPEVPLPDEVEILPWDNRWVPSTHEAHREAFTDHWGSVPPSLDEFAHWVEAPNFRPDLSFVAVAEGRVVSYSLNGVYPEDFDHRGMREGWIDTLGTRRAWRKRGLASALITESMRAFAADGLDHATLGVDAASPTGAFGLYESLGFEEHSQSVSLVKEVASSE
ncbi:MAG: GNAT family N-acetyltransferase [Acidimicrobiia bacterium]|nr:GNAT family N-acetyltransferase [Acidimicrobiia bacterium]